MCCTTCWWPNVENVFLEGAEQIRQRIIIGNWKPRWTFKTRTAAGHCTRIYNYRKINLTVKTLRRPSSFWKLLPDIQRGLRYHKV